MPAKKTEKKESTKVEEKVVDNTSDKIKELEDKIEALYQGMSEMRRDIKKVMGRMGL